MVANAVDRFTPGGRSYVDREICELASIWPGGEIVTLNMADSGLARQDMKVDEIVAEFSVDKFDAASSCSAEKEKFGRTKPLRTSP